MSKSRVSAGGLVLASAWIVLGEAEAARALELEAGKPIFLSCQTHSTVVAPTAASTKGTIRVRLEVKETEGQNLVATDRVGIWSVTSLDQAHTASLASRLKEACANGCALHVASGSSIELWAPKRGPISSVGVGEPLTIAVIDPVSLRIRASTFIDNGIAALEQGECALEP